MENHPDIVKLGPLRPTLSCIEWKHYWNRDCFLHYHIRLPARYCENLLDKHHPELWSDLTIRDIGEALNSLKPAFAAWFQKENDNGYVHYQMHLITINAINTHIVRECFYPAVNFRLNLYCKRATNIVDSYTYATKQRTRFDGPWFWSVSDRFSRCIYCNGLSCIRCSALLSNAL